MAVGSFVRLSPMDNVMPRVFANFIFSLRLNPGPTSKVHEVLQESLRRVCDELPVLRYRVFEIAPEDDAVTGRLEARSIAHWTPSVMLNDLSNSWPDYDELTDDGLPQDLLDGEVLLPKEIKQCDLKKEGVPVLLAQANFVQGGVLLAFGVFHPVIDGHSGSLLMKLWAKHARSLQTETINPGPTLAMHPESGDYGLLDRIWRDENKDVRPKDTVVASASAETWRLLGLLAPSEPSPGFDPNARPPKMRTTIFYVSASNFEALRAEANHQDIEDDNEREQITANDALMAMLWRCVTKARAKAADERDGTDYAPNATSLLDLTLDGRGIFSKALPWSYMGTLIFISTTAMSVGRLIDEHTSLSEIASNIRHSINAITSDRLQQAFDLARSLPDYGDSLRFPFSTFKGAEVCFTSWIGLSAYDICFGDVLFANGGHADFLRPPRREYDAYCRRCVVLPMQPSGGFEILLTLKEKEMEIFERDNEVVRYATIVCH
ncbi:transferase family-domain-containing protein [Xylariaceae sp. FL1272]|nr:transferase family-domain-containing protein [Xylariaceae sp. FL1272]